MSIEPRVRLAVPNGAWLASAATPAAGSQKNEPRRWLPGEPCSAGDGGAIDLDAAPPVALPPPLFDEAEVARLVAAAALDATERARAECASLLGTQRDRAMTRAADALAAALAGRVADEAASLAHVVELSAAMTRALTADRRTVPELGAEIRSMLATVAAVPSVRIVTCTDDEAAVSDLLPELVAASGFSGRIEVVAEPRLPGGALQLIWADGWLEHAPAAIRRRIDAVVALHRSTASASASMPAIAGDSTTSCVTPNGDEDVGN